MQGLENLYYELKPFLLLGLAVYAIASAEPNMVAIGSSLILLFTAGIIFRMRLKNRKGTGMESVLYETAPFAYLALGVYALVFLRESRLAVFCALLLLFIALMILRWRHQSRSNHRS